MVQHIKRISIKAPAILTHELIGVLLGSSPSFGASGPNNGAEGVIEAARDETEVVVEYDNESPVRWLLTWSVKVAAIVALVAIVRIIVRG